jgi:hypothetical protein
MRLVFLDSGPLGLLAKPQGKSKLGLAMASYARMAVWGRLKADEGR